MAKFRYSNKSSSKLSAKAVIRNAPASYKQCIEICSFIRGKAASTALKMLKDIADEKKPLPIKRFNRGGTGHRKGKTGPGRYPKKAVSVIADLINSAIANARFKSLDAPNMFIKFISAHKGENRLHYGRQRRRYMKRSNIELVLEEKEAKKEKKPKNRALPADKKKAQEIDKSEEKASQDTRTKKAPKISQEPVKESKSTEEEKAKKSEQKEEKPADAKKDEKK